MQYDSSQPKSSGRHLRGNLQPATRTEKTSGNTAR